MTQITYTKFEPGLGRFEMILLILLTVVSLCRAATRVYYIAAQEVDWDYAPSG